MIVGEGSMLGDLGQSMTQGHTLPGRQDVFCSDGEGQVCENQELFGLSTMRVSEDAALGVPYHTRLTPGPEYVPAGGGALFGLGQLFGTQIPYSALWSLLLGGALIGGSFLVKGDARGILVAVGAVVGGMAIVQTVNALAK